MTKQKSDYETGDALASMTAMLEAEGMAIQVRVNAEHWYEARGMIAVWEERLKNADESITAGMKRPSNTLRPYLTIAKRAIDELRGITLPGLMERIERQLSIDSCKAQEVMPPDVAAYLIQAGEEIAKEDGFTPSSEEEMRAWLSVNMSRIAERAIELQQELYNRTMSDRNLPAITDALSATVWGAIRTQQINAEVNRTIEDALR